MWTLRDHGNYPGLSFCTLPLSSLSLARARAYTRTHRALALCSPPSSQWLYTYTLARGEEANVPGSRLGERETSHEWLFSGARACTQRRDDGKRRVGREEGGGNGGGYNRGLMKPVEVRQTGSASSPFATLVLSPLLAPLSPPHHPSIRSVARSRRRDPSEQAEQRYRPVSLRLSPSFYLSVSNAASLSSPPLAPVSRRTAYLRHRSPPVTLALVCPPV